MPRRRTATPPEFVPPDLGLSSVRAAELEIRVRQILYRWRPQTEDPNNLARDLYALVDWVLDGEDPPAAQTLTVER